MKNPEDYTFWAFRFYRMVIMFERISNAEDENAYIFGILKSELNAMYNSTMEMSSFARSQQV